MTQCLEFGLNLKSVVCVDAVCAIENRFVVNNDLLVQQGLVVT